MPILLALGSSFAWGVADFAGGMASRKAQAISVVLVGNLVGVVVAIAAAIVEGSPLPGLADLGWGAAAGAAGGSGLAVLYHAIATTRVAVAAPAATLLGALAPILFGVVVGERPSPTTWTGMVIALFAVVAISTGPGEDRRGSTLRSVALGTAAGLGFGLFGILISRTGEASGLWPLVGARGASIAVMVSIALAWRAPLTPPRRRTLAMAGVAGLLDMAANVMFLVATRLGLLSVVAIIASMAPAWTIGLARGILHEPIGRVQAAGLGLAGAALVLIGLG
jgi:drug/metabolite transporter (DMT)-like permease